MAVAASNLTANGSAVSGSSYSTASITPGANHLILVTVTSRTNITANPNQPTISGNGLTWHALGTAPTDVWDNSGASRKRITTFYSMGASPSSGAITIDFAGQTQTHCAWVVDELTGINTGGTDGSGALNTNQVAGDNIASGMTLSITATLGSFASASNATYGAFTEGNNTQLTPGSGFSAVGYGASGVVTVTTIFRNDNDTTVDATEPTTISELGVIALEIVAASTTTATPSRMMMGMGT